MTETVFRRHFLRVIGVYFGALVAGIALKFCDPPKDGAIYGTFKDLVPLIIAIPAAWLGYCFQRRQAYLKDVRDLWSMVASAVQEAIQYTHLAQPPQAEYGRVLKSLSIAIEELRAVFTNVGESESQAGLFPFERLKDICGEVSRLGFGTLEPARAASTRAAIVEHWKTLRRHFLLELERGLPAQTDSPFLR